MSENHGIGFFERYLSIWVLLCIVAGVGLGTWFPSFFHELADLELYGINLPIAVLVWAMIFPMMVQIDFGSLRKAGMNPRGLLLTLAVNWLIKPFTMAFFAWIFFKYIYLAFLSPELADQYMAGAILLGVAPCTAMVFVWSYLSGGDPNYTLFQVSVNDLVVLVAFIPIVQWLLGLTSVSIPFDTLATSVMLFVAFPLLMGFVFNKSLRAGRGEVWFKSVFLSALKPVSIVALLATLLLIFALQGEVITKSPWNVLLIAIPLTIQTYFIFAISWLGGRWLKLPYPICAPAAMIGASNFFELAVAVAIMLFGIESGAVLATVVGVLIEVPIMLSLVNISKKLKYS